MLNTVIIDDEQNAIDELKQILDVLDKDVSVLGSAYSIKDGIMLINSLKPDLVFLDIELKDGLAFEILESPLLNHTIQIIFITGYNEHAIKAFEHSAIDYLLKPVEEPKLILAIKRALAHKDEKENKEKIEFMLRSLQNKQFSKIAIATVEGYEFVNKDEILYCESDSNYTYIQLLNKKILTSQVLKKMEELLFEANFFRVHKSFVININFVKKVLKAEGGKVIMENDFEIPIARRRREEFIKLLGV